MRYVLNVRGVTFYESDTGLAPDSVRRLVLGCNSAFGLPVLNANNEIWKFESKLKALGFEVNRLYADPELRTVCSMYLRHPLAGIKNGT
jgi:hypothetical protein